MVEFETRQERANNSKIGKTIEVDPGADNKEETTKVKINFMKNEVIDDYIKTQTKKAEETISSIDDKETPDQIRDRIKKDEGNKNNLTTEHYRAFAKFIIEAYDVGLSFLGRIIAKDTSSYAYTMDKGQKNVLIDQLVYVLIKYQAKFAIEILFLITLVSVSSGPIYSAIETRNKKAKVDKKNEEEKAAFEKKKEEIKGQPVKEVIVNKGDGIEDAQIISETLNEHIKTSGAAEQVTNITQSGPVRRDLRRRPGNPKGQNTHVETKTRG